jgi:hypothetical protein
MSEVLDFRMGIPRVCFVNYTELRHIKFNLEWIEARPVLNRPRRAPSARTQVAVSEVEADKIWAIKR